MRVHLTLAQIAESFGVEPNVVRGWVRDEALLCTDDRGALLFDRGQVADWAAQHGLMAKAGVLAPTVLGPRSSPPLAPMLRVGGIWRDVLPDQVLDTLEAAAARLPGATPAVLQLLAQRLRAPDGISWAPIGGGIALPHLAKRVTLGRDAGICALLFLRQPLDIGVALPDDVPITRLVFFIAPSPRAHLEVVGGLSVALLRGGLRRLLLEAAPDADIYAALAGPTTLDGTDAADAASADHPEQARP